MDKWSVEDVKAAVNFEIKLQYFKALKDATCRE